MKNKKSSMSVSLWILVIGTLFLVISSLAVFSIEVKKMKEKVLFVNSFEDIYSKENQINFYINNIIDKSVKDTLNQGMPDKYFADVFSDAFRNNLLLYKSGDNFIIPELEQIEIQINSENIKYFSDTKTINITFNIIVSNNIKAENGVDILTAVYSYTKTFSRDIGKI